MMYYGEDGTQEIVRRYMQRRSDRIRRRTDEERYPNEQIDWVTLENGEHAPISKKTGKVVGPIGEDREGALKLKSAESLPIHELRKRKGEGSKPKKKEKPVESRRGMLGEVLECKDMDSLKKLMSERYGIKRIDRIVTGTTKKYKQDNFDTLKGLLSTVASVIDEFPGLGEYIDSIEDAEWSVFTNENGDKAPAQVSKEIIDGTVFGDKAEIKNCRLQLSPACGARFSANGIYSRGEHPKNTTWEDIGAHEFGHVLEVMLMKRHMADMERIGRPIERLGSAWSNCDHLSDIIKGAYDDVRKSGSAMTDGDMRREISGYAETNLHETFAEAICDYNRNGDDASPLSKAIWNRAKNKLYGGNK